MNFGMVFRLRYRKSYARKESHYRADEAETFFPVLKDTLRIDPTPHWDLESVFALGKCSYQMATMRSLRRVSRNLMKLLLSTTPGVQRNNLLWLHQGAKALEATDLPEDMGYHWRRNGDITVESATPFGKALLHGEVDNETITWHPTGPSTLLALCLKSLKNRSFAQREEYKVFNTDLSRR